MSEKIKQKKEELKNVIKEEVNEQVAKLLEDFDKFVSGILNLREDQMISLFGADFVSYLKQYRSLQ
ncbi:MAG TPA: hypothetical protein V6C58_26115 [Allocoleopsis sp.]